jgi:hypothetical protein
MVSRWEATSAYLAEFEAVRWQLTDDDGLQLGAFLADALAPVQDRVQKISWNKKQGCFDNILIPHWSAEFCSFPDELCDCNTQGQTKIGEFYADTMDEVVYSPTAKGEGIEPTTDVTLKMIEAKR